MKRFFDWLRIKTIIVVTAVIALLGAISTRLVTCSTNTLLVTNQLATNPANQAVALETASLVANLFYEGADDPFPTSGAGGEIGKESRLIFYKGSPEFEKVLKNIAVKMDNIIFSARKYTPPNFKIQQGKRAIGKKLGDAGKSNANFKSAFDGIAITQENAEKLIFDILHNSDVITAGKESIRIYNSKGQGLSIRRYNAQFKGFVERQLENGL